MRSVLVIQHIGCETLGLFENESGDSLSFSYLRPYAGDSVPASLERWDSLIILGGPMAVYELESNPYLEPELELIGRTIESGAPLIGICLGAQLIAKAAGSRVYAGPVREVGWSEVTLTAAASSDSLFSGLPQRLPVFQLHEDSFDLPAGAARLAGNDIYENQAFRVGAKAYGLQFHVEATPKLVSEWAGEYTEYIEGAGTNRSEVLVNLEGRCEALRPIASQIIRRFSGLKPGRDTYSDG